MLVGMAANVNPIAAVAVMLSLGHSPSQTGVSVGIAREVAVELESAVGVAGSTAGPQEAKNNRIRLAGENRKIPVNFIFMAPYLSK